MLFDLLLLIYAGAIGFVAAGVLTSLYQLVTARPAGFHLLGAGAPAVVLSTLFFAVGGPMLMLRATVNGRVVDGQPVSWLFGGLAIAAVWGCCTGILALELALSIGNTFA